MSRMPTESCSLVTLGVNQKPEAQEYKINIWLMEAVLQSFQLKRGNILNNNNTSENAGDDSGKKRTKYSNL